MKRNLLILIFCLLFQPLRQANAQKNYSVIHYTGDNGLPQNSVKGISADSQGFIWLATEDGLVRFDGRRFYVFNEFNLKIRWNRTSYIFPEMRDSLAEPGYNKVSYASFYNGEVARIENGSAVRDYAYEKEQKAIQPLVAATGNSYYSFGLPDLMRRMDKSSAYKIMSGDGAGNFYICGLNNVSYFSNFKKKYTRPFAKGAFWDFFVMGKKLYYMHENASFKSISDKKITDPDLSGDIVNDRNYKTGKQRIRVFWNNVSRQVFLYLDKNLYTLDIGKSELTGAEILVSRLLVEDFDMVARGIEKIHYDKQNRKVYLGSGTDGFYVLSKQQFEVLTVRGSNTQNVFYSQLPYGNNAVVSSAGDIVGKDPVSGKMIDQKIHHLKTSNFSNKRTLVKDKYGAVWLPSGKSLFYFDSIEGKSTERWQFSATIETVHEGKSDYLWVPDVKVGLYRINLKEAGAKPELYIKNADLQVSCIESIDARRMLAGTWKGLYTVDIPSKEVKLVDGTEGLAIKSIHVFEDGNIWITALGKGLMHLDKKGKLTTFPLDKNRYLANPHCVINDGRGYIWIPTNKGLFQMSVKDLLDYIRLKAAPAELFYLYHARDEGFNTNEFNGNCVPCGLNLTNGYISLPSLNGFVWFRPEQIDDRCTEGEIILDNVLVNQKPLAASNDTLYFPLNPEQIKLNFSTSYFGNKYNLKISYALIKENVAERPFEWIPLDDETFKLEFSYLNSGNYILMVRKQNGFGINNYTIKKVYFVVPLLWYQTWWADILMVIGLIAGIYFYNIWKLKQVKLENARLEDVITLRTKKLNETLVDLEDSKNDVTRQVHVLSRLLTSITHDIQSPLNFVKLTSGNIPKLIKRGALDEVSALGEIISDSSQRMSSLLKGLLDYIKVHVFEDSLHFEAIDLKPLVDEKFAIFKNMIIENSSDFTNTICDDATVYCDYQMLGIIIHNLIDNAAKFTHKGTISVYFFINDENKKELVISNTTVGVPQEIRDMINAPENENLENDIVTGYRRTSLGLLIVKEIAALVDIRLKVTQTEITSFHLIFNNFQFLGKPHEIAEE